MRIALVYDGVYPWSVGGGEKVFHDLALDLSARHDVHMFALKLWEGPDTITLAPRLRLHGVCAPDHSGVVQSTEARSVKQAIRFAARVYSALSRRGPFDIVDCMSTPYFPLYSAWLRCRLSGTPLVSTWLESWRLEEWEEYIGSGLKARAAYHLEGLATRLPGHIISISRQTTARLLAKGVASARVSTVVPWIDTRAIDSVAPDAHPSDLLFVGRLIASKGAALLVEALVAIVARHPEIRCRIIGDGPERAALEGAISAHGIGANVRIEPFLEEHAQVVAAMKSSRVFVLPSRREGFGIVVLESVAAGLLPVTIDAPNNASRHLVRESGCGEVCEATPTALAESIEHLLAITGEQRVALVARGRAWAETYDMRHGFTAYEATYQRVAKGEL